MFCKVKYKTDCKKIEKIYVNNLNKYKGELHLSQNECKVLKKKTSTFTTDFRLYRQVRRHKIKHVRQDLRPEKANLGCALLETLRVFLFTCAMSIHFKYKFKKGGKKGYFLEHFV